MNRHLLVHWGLTFPLLAVYSVYLLMVAGARHTMAAELADGGPMIVFAAGTTAYNCQLTKPQYLYVRTKPWVRIERQQGNVTVFGVTDPSMTPATIQVLFTQAGIGKLKCVPNPAPVPGMLPLLLTYVS